MPKPIHTQEINTLISKLITLGKHVEASMPDTRPNPGETNTAVQNQLLALQNLKTQLGVSVKQLEKIKKKNDKKAIKKMHERVNKLMVLLDDPRLFAVNEGLEKKMSDKAIDEALAAVNTLSSALDKSVKETESKSATPAASTPKAQPTAPAEPTKSTAATEKSRKSADVADEITAMDSQIKTSKMLSEMRESITVYEREPDAVDYFDQTKLLRNICDDLESRYEKIKNGKNLYESQKLLRDVELQLNITKGKIKEYKLANIETKIRFEVKWIEGQIGRLLVNPNLDEDQKAVLAKMKSGLSGSVERWIEGAKSKTDPKEREVELVKIQERLNQTHNFLDDKALIAEVKIRSEVKKIEGQIDKLLENPGNLDAAQKAELVKMKSDLSESIEIEMKNVRLKDYEKAGLDPNNRRLELANIQEKLEQKHDLLVSLEKKQKEEVSAKQEEKPAAQPAKPSSTSAVVAAKLEPEAPLQKMKAARATMAEVQKAKQQAKRQKAESSAQKLVAQKRKLLGSKSEKKVEEKQLERGRTPTLRGRG